MRVLFDHQAFCMQRHGGVSRCFAELYLHLPKEVQATIALKECNNAYVREMKLCPEESDAYNRWIFPGNWPAKGRLFNAYNWLKGNRKGLYWDKYAYNQKESIKQLKTGNFDIFHPTFLSDYFLPYLNGKPFVITIHDMIPELYPQYYKESFNQIEWKKKLAPLASAIIAVSENTKKDIIRLLNVPEEKVHVIYHGSSFPPIEKTKPLVDGPYLLYIGERKYYKNFDVFVREASIVLQAHPKLKVICTGSDFTEEEISLFEQFEVQNRFKHLWVKSDSELYSLYHFAKCFIYTSEYEGFGIPILEAYQAGCPVLLNNASCFPEIAGDAAVYFRMNRTESNLNDALLDFLSWTKVATDDLLIKQQAQLQRYSWTKSAQQLFELYKSVC